MTIEEKREKVKQALLLYGVTDRAWVGDKTFEEQIEDSLKGGVTCIQLREKSLKEDEFLEEAKKINKMILSFVEETLMFIVKTTVIFPVYFMRSINKSIEPNLTDNQSKIKEGTIGISIESLYNIREYLADKSVINDEKREVANIIESLEQIYEKKTDFKIDLFYKQYYCSADPLVQIQNMQENLSCTYQTACEEYAKCIIKGIE